MEGANGSRVLPNASFVGSSKSSRGGQDLVASTRAWYGSVIDYEDILICAAANRVCIICPCSCVCKVNLFA